MNALVDLDIYIYVLFSYIKGSWSIILYGGNLENPY